MYFSSLYKYPNRHRFVRPAALLLDMAIFCLLFAGAAILYDPAENGGLSMRALGANALLPAEEYPQGSLPDGVKFDKLLLEKSKRRLTAYVGSKPTRIYLVALGENPVGHKQFEGDKRTPEGTYIINDKNPNSAYYKNIGISYPNAEDRARAKKFNKRPGGDIKIHGLAPHFADIGAAHRLMDWTYGCIAVTNPEIEEIFSRTAVGTPIEIVP
ncbi:MAG: L,D-transpeptidase family protein [Desulfovibrio sp.]|jgi:hypothetical protein|nr:L,D-transpeptidase family protein [Desulfovibrio sp.]